MDSRFVAAFVAGGIAGACVSCTLFHHRDAEAAAAAAAARNEVGLAKTTSTRDRQVSTFNHMDDEIVREHFTRNIQFFGEKGQQRVARAFIIVVGLGGVGSHCAHMLLAQYLTPGSWILTRFLFHPESTRVPGRRR